MSNQEEWKRTFWTRLSDYLSRRALLREYFVPFTVLPLQEGIELLANLTTLEKCFDDSEKHNFSLSVLEGNEPKLKEWGWQSQELHFLAQGSFYSLYLSEFQGTVGCLQVKDKTISKRGKELHVIKFSYPVDGYYESGLIIPRLRHKKGDFVMGKFRGFVEKGRPRLRLVTGNSRIAATLEQRCQVSVDKPTGIFLFEDEKQNVYINPPQYRFRNSASHLAYPPYVGELLEIQKGNNAVQVALVPHHYYGPVIMGKPHPHFLYELAWRVSSMRERRGEEFIQQHQLESLTEETIGHCFEYSMIEKFLEAWKESIEEKDLPLHETRDKYIEKNVERIRTLQREYEYTLKASEFQLNPEYHSRIPDLWYD